MIDKNNLSRGMEKLIRLGPKLTGSPAQMAFIAYIKKELRDMGLEVMIDPFYFPRWEAKEASLAIEDVNGEMVGIPVSSVHPYSGETPDEGVTTQLIYLNKLDKMVKAEGKIIVIKIEDLGRIHSEVAFDKRSAFPEDTVMPAFYNGPVATAMVRCLAEGALKLLRPAGAVFVWDGIPDEAVQGQYMPFIQEYLGLPVLWVNETTGKTLIEAAKAGRTAHMLLTAEKERYAYTETFYTILPGEKKEETVIVNTHTDGPNAIEENGPIALLELIRQLKDRPLKRTHIFLFTTGHFRLPKFRDIRTGSFQSASKWLAKHRNLWDGKGDHLKCVANLAIEHLGCMGWTVENGEYRATGLPEVEMVYTGNKFMDDLYIDVVSSRRKLTRSITLKGHNLLHFGEGQNFFTMGIPGICLVPGPYYLCVESDTMEEEKYELDLMAEQTDTFYELICRIEDTDTETLGKSDDYSFVFAKSVSGGEGFQPGFLTRKLIKKRT